MKRPSPTLCGSLAFENVITGTLPYFATGQMSTYRGRLGFETLEFN